jgi:uncharacterized membrane protein
MSRLAIAYVATALVFIGIDFIWLSRSIGFYRSELGGMLLERPNMGAAVAFYLIYIAGVVALAVLPANSQSSWSTALLHGAALGLVAYATYDLTNLATLKDWSLTVTLVDLAWGTFLTAVASVAGFWALRLTGH